MLDEAKKPKINSRDKGASFERRIAGQLLGLTGITFKRNLVQTQQAGQSDLIPDDPAWPFELECKFYKEGNSCAKAWRDQAMASAKRTGRIPAVIYKFNNMPVRVSVPFAAWGDGNMSQWAEIDLEGLAYLAGEIMAARVEASH